MLLVSLFPFIRRSFPYSMNVCFCCASPYHYPCGVAFIPCHRRPSAACGAGPPYPNSCKGKYTQLQRHWHLRKKRDRAGFFAYVAMIDELSLLKRVCLFLLCQSLSLHVRRGFYTVPPAPERRLWRRPTLRGSSEKCERLPCPRRVRSRSARLPFCRSTTWKLREMCCSVSSHAAARRRRSSRAW